MSLPDLKVGQWFSAEVKAVWIEWLLVYKRQPPWYLLPLLSWKIIDTPSNCSDSCKAVSSCAEHRKVACPPNSNSALCDLPVSSTKVRLTSTELFWIFGISPENAARRWHIHFNLLIIVQENSSRNILCLRCIHGYFSLKRDGEESKQS